MEMGLLSRASTARAFSFSVFCRLQRSTNLSSEAKLTNAVPCAVKTRPRTELVWPIHFWGLFFDSRFHSRIPVPAARRVSPSGERARECTVFLSPAHFLQRGVWVLLYDATITESKKEKRKTHEISFCSLMFHSTTSSPPEEYPVLPSSEKTNAVTFFVCPLRKRNTTTSVPQSSGLNIKRRQD